MEEQNSCKNETFFIWVIRWDIEYMILYIGYLSTRRFLSIDLWYEHIDYNDDFSLVIAEPMNVVASSRDIDGPSEMVVSRAKVYLIKLVLLKFT